MLEHHPRNEFKFCPFCGANMFAFDGAKKFRCENCGRTLYLNAAAASSAIIETPKGILFVRRKLEPKKNMLDLPGGFIDLDERAEDGMLRELCEEICLPKNTPLRYFTSFPNHYVYNNLLYTTLDLFFTCRLESTDMLFPNDDASSIEYIKSSEIKMNDIAFESSKNALKLYLEDKV